MFAVYEFLFSIDDFSLLAVFPDQCSADRFAKDRRDRTGETVFGPFDVPLSLITRGKAATKSFDVLAPLTEITFRCGAVEIMVCGEPFDVPFDQISDPDLAALQIGDRRRACQIAAEADQTARGDTLAKYGAKISGNTVTLNKVPVKGEPVFVSYNYKAKPATEYKAAIKLDSCPESPGAPQAFEGPIVSAMTDSKAVELSAELRAVIRETRQRSMFGRHEK